MGLFARAVICGWLLLAGLGADSARAQSGWADDDEQAEDGASGWGADPDDEPAEDADDGGDDGEYDDAGDEGEDATPTERPRWFFGAFTRMVSVPAFMLKLFLDEAPGVLNGSGGAVVNYRTDTFTVEFGIGYTSYGFAGAYRAKGDPEVDTEYVTSNLGMVHLTGSMLWAAEFHPMFAFEYGFGLDLGVITGSMVRSEAYPSGDGYAACRGVLNPPAVTAAGQPYCEPTQSGGPTDAYDAEGAHYGVTEERIPPVMAFPMIPHLALRFMPHRQVMVKLEASYGIVEFYLGLSAFAGFDL